MRTGNKKPNITPSYDTWTRVHDYEYPLFTAVGAAQFDQAEQALLLNGTSDYVSFPDSSNWAVVGSSGNYEISLIVKSDVNTHQTFVEQYEDADNWWALYYDSSVGKYNFVVKSVGSSTVSQYSLNPLQNATSSIRSKSFSVPLPFSDVTTDSQPFSETLDVPCSVCITISSNVSFFLIILSPNTSRNMSQAISLASPKV